MGKCGKPTYWNMGVMDPFYTVFPPPKISGEGVDACADRMYLALVKASRGRAWPGTQSHLRNVTRASFLMNFFIVSHDSTLHRNDWVFSQEWLGILQVLSGFHFSNCGLVGMTCHTYRLLLQQWVIPYSMLYCQEQFRDLDPSDLITAPNPPRTQLKSSLHFVV